MEPPVIESSPQNASRFLQERIVSEQEQLAGPRVITYMFVGSIVTIGLLLWLL